MLFFVQCKKQQNISFYYWETTYKLNSAEQNYLSEFLVKKLYVRFFDIDKENGQSFPVATIQIQEKNNNQEIVPVVFITNETFRNTTNQEIIQLANHAFKEIKYIYPKISDGKIEEIQFDCDWTVQTKENYFLFLKTVQQISKDIVVSATIRLHQIKDKQQTGIPPIEKGVLMYYATSSPIEDNNNNSILDNNTAKNYIENLDEYPIKLDVALPIYSWAIVTNELGEKRLVNGIRPENLSDSTLYQKLNKNNYRVKKEHYLNAIFVYENYEIKIEYISENDLQIAAKNIRKKINNKSFQTILYYLDDKNIKHYSTETLKNL